MVYLVASVAVVVPTRPFVPDLEYLEPAFDSTVHLLCLGEFCVSVQPVVPDSNPEFSTRLALAVKQGGSSMTIEDDAASDEVADGSIELEMSEDEIVAEGSTEDDEAASGVEATMDNVLEIISDELEDAMSEELGACVVLAVISDELEDPMSDELGACEVLTMISDELGEILSDEAGTTLDELAASSEEVDNGAELEMISEEL